MKSPEELLMEILQALPVCAVPSVALVKDKVIFCPDLYSMAFTVPKNKTKIGIKIIINFFIYLTLILNLSVIKVISIPYSALAISSVTSGTDTLK